jgi:hypothetical protein
MSTTWNQFVIYGVKIPYKNNLPGYVYKSWEPYMRAAEKRKGFRHHKGLAVLYDGRDGRFTIIGRILARSNDSEQIDGPIGLKIPDAKVADLVKGAIEHQFNIKDPEPKLWLVTMYR